MNEPVLMIGAALLCIAPMGMAWGQVAPASNAVQTINVTGYADPVQKTEFSNDPAANPASATALKLTERKPAASATMSICSSRCWGWRRTISTR